MGSTSQKKDQKKSRLILKIRNTTWLRVEGMTFDFNVRVSRQKEREFLKRGKEGMRDMEKGP